MFFSARKGIDSPQKDFRRVTWMHSVVSDEGVCTAVLVQKVILQVSVDTVSSSVSELSKEKVYRFFRFIKGKQQNSRLMDLTKEQVPVEQGLPASPRHS